MVYKFEKVSESSFEFTTNSDITYVVKFKKDKKLENSYERIFYPKLKYNTIEMYELTNKGDSFSVLSTVSNITKKFITENRPDLVVIYHIPTTKEEDNMDNDIEYYEKNETKRQRVFRRFLSQSIDENYKIIEEVSTTKLVKVNGK
jgi:hypothetical protein